MKNIGLQNIIMGIFIFAAVVAILIFSGVVKLGNDARQAQGKVTVWGTIPFGTIQPYIEQAQTKNINITYRVQNEETYENDLINAIAAGTGPDLFIMPHENILRHKDKVFEIPYTSFPQRDYQNTYIDESKLFLTDTGVLALPLSVDPLVMYYNKNLIASSFLLDIPEYWDELLEFVPAINVVDANGEIITSGAAIGTFDNLLNAKGLMSALLLQNGNPLVGTDSSTGKKISTLAFNEDLLLQSVQSLEFFTSFARFGNENYSWNEALPTSRDAFIAGDLAIYFGQASELEDIRRKNPNLDFDVALLPQVRDSKTRLTYGSMRGIGISKQSPNVSAAISVASSLAGKDIAGNLASDLLVAPARKDLLRNKPEEAYLTLFYNSAIISVGWVDSDRTGTNDLFRDLVRNINTGALSVTDALQRTHADLNTLLNRTINTTIVDQTIPQ